MSIEASPSVAARPSRSRSIWIAFAVAPILFLIGAGTIHRQLGGIAHEVDTLDRRANAVRIALELEIAFAELRRAADAVAFQSAAAPWRARLDEGHAQIRGAERRRILRRIDDETVIYTRDFAAGDADVLLRRGHAIADDIAAIKASAGADRERVRHGLDALIARTKLICIALAVAGLAAVAATAILIRRRPGDRSAPRH